MNRKLFAVLPIAASFAFGCGILSHDGGSGGDDGKGDQASGHSLRPTNQSGLALFQGFNTLYDENSAPCVDPIDQSNSAPLTVGDLQEEYQLYYVKSKSDLSKSINVDFGLSATVLKIVNANAAFSLLKNFQTSATSVTFLVAAKQNYSVSNNRPVKLVDGLPDVTTNEEFLHRCQNYYVNGLEFEADLFVLISFQARDEETSSMIKASLGVSSSIPGGAILGNIDGHLSGALVSAAAMNGVSTKVVAVSRGFLLSGTDTSGSIPLGDTLNADTFNKIDSLRTAMAQSVLNDQCRDTGDSGLMCNGVASPGYDNNVQRSATPVGVLLGSYQRATNAPFNPPAFQALDDELANAEKYIRGLTSAQIAIENIYDSEIAPFYSASGADQAAFQLAPPQTPATSIAALNTALSPWRAAFQPDDGAGNVGSALSAIHDSVVACWEHGSDADFTACHLGDDPKQTQEYMNAQAQIASYASTGRVLPLHFIIGGKSVFASKAQSLCSALNLDEAALNPASLADATALQILIATAALPPSTASSVSHTVWVNDPSCGPTAGFESQTGMGTEDCGLSDTLAIPVICVPGTGVFGSIPDPGTVP
jgi:hypothetical protein